MLKETSIKRVFIPFTDNNRTHTHTQKQTLLGRPNYTCQKGIYTDILGVTKN